MVTGITAEAGLSECVREVPGCASEMDTYFLVLSAVAFVVVVHLALALTAVVDVLTSRTGVTRGLAWLIVVTVLPIVGPLARFRASRRAHRDTPPG